MSKMAYNVRGVFKKENILLIALECILHITKTCPCNIQRIFFCSKIENFHQKNFDIFRRGGSNEYPQSMFGAKIRKIGIPLHTPVVGFEGVYIARTCFPDEAYM